MSGARNANVGLNSMMKLDEFESQLRELLRREPFEPFTIVVADGRTIYVDKPSIAFGGGRGGFIPAEGSVEFFDYEQVVAFRPLHEGTAQ